MGTTDRTDGTWVWPEGLSHYLRVHKLPLPEQVLISIDRNGYQIPRGAAHAIDAGRYGEYDYAFWHEWAASVYRRDQAK